MEQFCPTTPNECVNPANPVTNFSSEAPDEEVFIGRSYSSTQDPPPLGGIWYANSCRGLVISHTSQQDADDRAAQAAVTCLPYVHPDPNPNPDPEQPPYIFVQNNTYTNDEQSCSVTCADGSTYTYTVPAGTVTAFSLAAANTQAHSLACNRAVSTKICIGNLTNDSVCLNSLFNESVTFSIGVPPAQVAVISGTLPPGISLFFGGTIFDTTFTLTGVATTIGSYAFTIRVNDLSGNYHDKLFTIRVGTIANATLAAGTVGVAYSDTLTAGGSTSGAIQWSVVSGSLPAGLTLDPNTGVISGTPTTAATYAFTIQMQDGL